MSRIHDALRKADQSDVLDAQEWPIPVPVRDSANGHHATIDDLCTTTPPEPHAARSASGFEDCRRLTWRPDSRTVLSFDEPRTDSATEQFRGLRSRLYQMREVQPLKSLVVTSALSGEGKSFVATNLAQVLSLHAERRVLLIDADLRTPRLHFGLGTSSTPGLAEVLLQEAGQSTAIQKGEVDNLFFMPAGRPVRNPSELLSNGQFRALIARLQDFFDWIVIDSPSAIQFSDTVSLASSCGGVLVVVRANTTPSDVVRKALEKFSEDTLLGVVLNEGGADVDRSPTTGERHAS
jgi:protein-tyrosine kinase